MTKKESALCSLQKISAQSDSSNLGLGAFPQMRSLIYRMGVIKILHFALLLVGNNSISRAGRVLHSSPHGQTPLKQC